MKNNWFAKTLVITVLTAALTGCGSQPADAEQAVAETQESTAESQDSATAMQDTDSSVTQTQTQAAVASPADEMIGEWDFMCSIYHSEDEEGDYDYVTMRGDEYAIDSSVRIRREGDRFLADYKSYGFESSDRIYGAELAYMDREPYRDAEGQSWCMELTDPFEETDEDSVPYRFSIKDDDILIVSWEHLANPSEEYSYYYVSTNYYMRKDDPRLDDTENLRYFDTVTVNNATDMLNEIKNNRKIILADGRYDLSAVKQADVNNKNVGFDYDGVTISNISNLCLESENGADILFSIDDPYSPVLNVSNCSNFVIRGVTAGHNVEPGYCSGSVLHFADSDHVSVDKCNLYGSGTYGIEASYTSEIHVTDSDIYECTYGLVDLRNSGSALFENCKLRDSEDLTLINFYDGYDLTFDNCEFSGNRSAYETCYFVGMGEYDRVTFKNCSFKNNQFVTFSNREVTMENCTYDNNYAAFSDMIKSSDGGGLSKEQILQNYDDALKKQAEIDSKLGSDSLLDQLTLNQLAYQQYELWDTLLNQIWAYMGESLDEGTMTTATEEQRAWIREKEAGMKDAGASFEGGSMQPMVEYGNGADATRKRVETLLDKYVR